MIHRAGVGSRLVFLSSVLLGNPLALGAGEIAEEDAAAATSDSPESSSTAASVEPEASSGSKKKGIEEIEVLGERTGRRAVISLSEAVGTLTREEMKRSDGLLLEESINLLPGVRLESRTVSGGQRITIRGYGNNTNFNGTGYKAYLNGIPITDAEGITILDDVDISTLGGIEVIKGPASSLYGAGIGGVVKMYTVRPERKTTRFTQELIGGSLSLLRTNARAEHGGESSSVLVNYGHQHSDGYRIHSQSNRDFLLFSANLAAQSKQSLDVYAAFSKTRERLAGQLTEEQFLTKQNVAEPAYLANDAHVGLDSVRVGLSHSYEFHPSVNNVTSAYGSGYQLDQPFAGGRTDNSALNFGGRTAFNLLFGEPTLGVAGVIGGEIQQTNAFKKSYNLNDGILGAIRGDLQVTALQASTFTQWDLLLPYEITVTAGASLNFVHYNIKDRLTNTANPSHADQSGVKDFTPVVTPRVALLKSFDRRLSIYGQISQGYTPPASASVVIPQIGAVNSDLKPERATLYELGSKGNLVEGRLWYEIALFDMEVKDKITSQAVSNDAGTVLYTFNINAGTQSNRGLELGVKFNAIDQKEGVIKQVQPFVTYTFSRFRYDDFQSFVAAVGGIVDYSGKKVVGVPMNVLNLGLDTELLWGIYLHGTYQYVDSMPLTFDNTQNAKSYSLLDAKIGYRKEFDRHFRLDVSAGGSNLLGSLYYKMVFLNATGNIYLPGPYSATFYGGANLSYSL